MNRFEEIETIKQKYLKHSNNETDFKRLLKRVLDEINLLEQIYSNSVFGEELRDLAYSERQKLCLHSSALYDILRGEE